MFNHTCNAYPSNSAVNHNRNMKTYSDSECGSLNSDSHDYAINKSCPTRNVFGSAVREVWLGIKAAKSKLATDQELNRLAHRCGGMHENVL